jgi:hypothetical protein
MGGGEAVGRMRFRKLRIALVGWVRHPLRDADRVVGVELSWVGAIIIPLSGNRAVAFYVIKGTIGAGTFITERSWPLTFDAYPADLAIEAWRGINVTPPSPWFGGFIKNEDAGLP